MKLLAEGKPGLFTAPILLEVLKLVGFRAGDVNGGTLSHLPLGGGVMLVRKPLVLAMLAAGVIASDGLPEAQSTVFVPELAMLDGALCTGTMVTAPMQPLLLAQMKTEVSPAPAKAAASAAPAPASADHPLTPGLAARSFKIITKP